MIERRRVRSIVLSVATDTSQTPAGSRWRTDFQYDGRQRLRKRIEYVWNSGGSGSGAQGGGAGPLTGVGWTVNSVTCYVYDGRLVIQERDASNTPTVSYTRGIDVSGTPEGAGGIGGLLARSSGYSGGNWSTHNYYHADGNGNITYLVSASQAMVANYRYDPFGRTTYSGGSLAGANLCRFSSKEVHVNSGMYYYGYRFYDPAIQRWVNRDPLGHRGGPNLYEFERNNAMRFVDPQGRIIFFEPGTSDSFRQHWLDCMCILAQSARGYELLRLAAGPGIDIQISPNASRKSPASGEPSDDDGIIPKVGISLDSGNCLGLGPEAPIKDYPAEIPPETPEGCAIVLAHELGHVLGEHDEPEGWNVTANENPVRADLGVITRRCYHGQPLLPPITSLPRF